MKYKGREINPPHIIAWRLSMYVLVNIFLIPACIIAWIGFGQDTALDLWEVVN